MTMVPGVTSRGRAGWVAVLLLGAGFALLMLGLHYNAVTWDEYHHIAVGYALLARGREAFRFLGTYWEPPLINAVDALMLFGLNPRVPVENLAGWSTSVYWDFSQAFGASAFSAEQFQTLGRFPNIFLTMLLGATLYRWGKSLWGATAGLLALALYVLDPTILAHGRLATIDLGVTALGTAALFCVWRWVRAPSWRLALTAGGLLGLTFVAKHSGVIWAAAIGMILSAAIIRRIYHKQSPQLLLGQGAVLFGLSLLILWGVYGFSWGKIPGTAISVPAPEYWRGLVDVSGSIQSQWTFALGFRRYGGWWWYFPAAFVLKNPLPFLALLGLGSVVLLGASPRRFLFLGLFPAIYWAAAIYSRFNIGYRHMLPVHPLYYLILAGGVWVWLRAPSRLAWGKALLVVGLLGWQCISVMRTWPNDLAYFNELIGGPQNAYKYLVDSNLDWGQRPPELRQAIFAAYPGIQTDPPKRLHSPSPGLYLFDASAVQGVWIRFAFEWFRHIEPKRVIDATQLVFEVPQFDPAWLAQCEVPSPPLNDQAMAQEFGGPQWRNLHFDCSQAWIFPTGGAEEGIYALNYALNNPPGFDFSTFMASLPAPKDDFVARHLAEARFSFDRPWQGDSDVYSSVGFVLYELSRKVGLPSLPPQLYAGPADLAPGQVSPSLLVSSPPRLGEALTFLGVKTYFQAGGVEVETWWRYTQEAPVSRPFSIMAHLIQADGTAVEVADGLGVSPLALRPGDIVVQRHKFSVPADGQPLWLQTGVYWLDDMERWQVSDASGANTLLLPVSK